MATDTEIIGHEETLACIDNLLACHTQAEAVPVITDFMEQIGNIKGRKNRKGYAAGAATALVDVLMTGLRNLPKVLEGELDES